MEGLPLASCAACHGPHRVEPAGTSTSHLINLDRDYVTPSETGRLEFVDGALPRTGSCCLTCHGEDHNPYSYPP